MFRGEGRHILKEVLEGVILGITCRKLDNGQFVTCDNGKWAFILLILYVTSTGKTFVLHSPLFPSKYTCSKMK